MKNASAVGGWLATVGPHLYCCGHVHAAWAFKHDAVPGHLSINAGAPLLRDPTGLRPPGFMELILKDRDVTAIHHVYTVAQIVDLLSGNGFTEFDLFAGPGGEPYGIGSGRLLRTPLVNVLFLDDGRVAAGFVSAPALEAAVAHG